MTLSRNWSIPNPRRSEPTHPTWKSAGFHSPLAGGKISFQTTESQGREVSALILGHEVGQRGAEAILAGSSGEVSKGPGAGAVPVLRGLGEGCSRTQKILPPSCPGGQSCSSSAGLASHCRVWRLSFCSSLSLCARLPKGSLPTVPTQFLCLLCLPPHQTPDLTGDGRAPTGNLAAGGFLPPPSRIILP